MVEVGLIMKETPKLPFVQDAPAGSVLPATLATAAAPAIGPPLWKIHCSVLAEDAIKAAVADIKAKQAAKVAATV